ncbi:YncE family protein [Roseateles sp.]|uniref:YncE family protein n=1 Tax=Roseateles sp. TaxID=1971397 RepID=UPI003BAA23EA
MSAGYLDSPWPAEDAGPQRLQQPRSGAGLGLRTGETLRATTRRTTMSTMTVLGAPGEVYLLTHSALRAQIGLPTTACVERIDPTTLKPQQRSPRLRGGPMWPGGMAIHRNGDLYVVYGRHAHRLTRDCRPLASLQLPMDQPYNSFVVLDNGLIVTKNLSAGTPARLTVIDPGSLTPACADVEAPEPSIARLSARGDTVYVVGVRSIFRYHWRDAARTLTFDPDWRFDYIGDSGQSHGWDVVLADQHAWFMDNGAHRYRHRMLGAGVSRTANRLIRVSLTAAADHQALDVSGLPGGSITNPPLVDAQRGIVVGYDSANAVLRAWRFDAGLRTLTPLWRKAPFGCASHMVLYPDTGEVVVNDYCRHGEEVVVLDIATGTERGRVRTGGLMQGVVFPSPGWGRDLYWSSMGRLARVSVA